MRPLAVLGGAAMILGGAQLVTATLWSLPTTAAYRQFAVAADDLPDPMADAVIAVSQETKVDILRFFHADPKKIHVIHNGIDPDAEIETLPADEGGTEPPADEPANSN